MALAIYGFRRFQIVLGGFDILFGAADFGGHGSEFSSVVLLRLRELGGDFWSAVCCSLRMDSARLWPWRFPPGSSDFLLGDLPMTF